MGGILHWSHRLAVITAAIVTLMPVLMWMVTGSIPESPSAPKNFGLPRLHDGYLELDIWVWGLTTLVGCSIAIMLAVRRFRLREQQLLAWGLVAFSFAIAVFIFLRGYLFHPDHMGTALLKAQDAVAMGSIVLGLWIFCRLFYSFPSRINLARIQDGEKKLALKSPLNKVLWGKPWSANWNYWNLVVVCHPAFLFAALYFTIFAVWQMEDLTTLLLSGESIASWFWFIPIVFIPFMLAGAFMQLIAFQHSSGSVEEKGRLAWMYSAVIIGFMLFVILMGMTVVDGLLGNIGAEICDYAGAGCFDLLHANDVYSLFYGLIALTIVVSIVLSILGSGTFEPSLAVGKSAVYSVMMLGFFLVFVVIEELLESEFLARLDVDPSITAVISGAIAASLYRNVEAWVGVPLEQYFEKRYESPERIR